MTTFLLDPRVLDDCVSDSAPDVEVVGDGAGYRVLEDGHKRYAFFLHPQEQKIPRELIHLAYDVSSSDHCTLYHCSLASVIVFSSKNGGGRNIPRKDWKHLYSILYGHGEFIKGDVETLKIYGINIL